MAGNLGQVASLSKTKVAAPLVLAKGMKLHYDGTSVQNGETQTAEFIQEILAVTPTAATIRGTTPAPSGPSTGTYTAKLDPALVTTWTSQAPLSKQIDPGTGTSEVITVKAGTFRTQKVVLSAPAPYANSGETWWFSGKVPVKVAYKGLNAGKMDATIELTSD
jgi:hypothetical protein